jgi:hypothetical protein
MANRAIMFNVASPRSKVPGKERDFKPSDF